MGDKEEERLKCQVCGRRSTDSLLCVCADCAKGAAGIGQARKIRDVANILDITADTDGNIKDAMESLLEIAGDLEVFGHAEKQEKE
ncbi:MAG: hypothetical protein NC331_13955 [Lachnospiraceae bacterium]|nr:hypothetical protein [Lachnospiraceae bacterium]MCM1240468.1 hypothetical protein [Lachnospiraceae bacterium]